MGGSAGSGAITLGDDAATLEAQADPLEVTLRRGDQVLLVLDRQTFQLGRWTW